MKSIRVNRILSTVLCLSIVIGITGINRETVLADTDPTLGLTYTTANGVATITGFTAPVGFDGIMDIPSTLGGASVSTIGKNAFRYNDCLTSLTIPASVNTIAEGAFQHCDGLISLTIPGSVLSIGNGAFWACSELSVLALNNGITSIDDSAFRGCGKLVSISIPSSVVFLGDRAFGDCSKLTNIAVDAANKVYCSVDGILYTKDLKKILAFPTERTGSFTIPSTTTSIGNYAFENCEGLTNVTIPDSITSIGSWAFSTCNNMITVIPDSVTSIGAYAFRDCDGFVDLVIPKSISTIEEGVFCICDGLKSITIHSGVTKIGNNAFSWIPRVPAVYFQGNAPTMGTDVFTNYPTDFTIYYYSGAAGFTSPTWMGYKSALMARASAIEKIDEIKQTYPIGNTSFTSFHEAIQCKGFAKFVFWTLFGVDLPSTDSNGYTYSNHTNVIPVGTLSSGEVTAESLKSLLCKARTGDVIQAMGSSVEHTMIFEYTTENGIRVYDCNSKGDNAIDDRSITYVDLANRYSKGFSLYTSNNYPFQPKPGTPSNLHAVKISDTSINLLWDAVTGADGYEVYQSTTSIFEGFNKIITTATCTASIDLPVASNSYFYVKSYSNNGASKEYGEPCIAVYYSPAPSAPLNVAAVSVGYNSNKLTWTAVTGATGYAIYRSTSPSSGFAYIKSVTSASYTNTGLTTGTTYYYQIKTYTLVDTTKNYSAATAAVSAKPLPAAPTGPKAVSAGYNSNKLTWNAVAGATGYSIYRSTLPTSGFAYIKTVTSASYTNTGLTTGTTYYYQIKAYTLVGTTKIYSAFTSVVSAKPVPAAPTGLTAASASTTSIKVSWNAVTGATGYAMYRSTSPTSDFTYVKSVTSASYTNTGLTTGTTYYYQIKAYTMAGTTKIYSTATAAVGAKP